MDSDQVLGGQMNCSSSSQTLNPSPPSKKSKKRKKKPVKSKDVEKAVSPGAQRLIADQASVSVQEITASTTGTVSELKGLNAQDLELIRSASNLGPIYCRSSLACSVTVTCSSSSSQLSSARIESSHLYGGIPHSTACESTPAVPVHTPEEMSAPPVVPKSREEVEAERKARKAAKAAAKGKSKEGPSVQPEKNTVKQTGAGSKKEDAPKSLTTAANPKPPTQKNTPANPKPPTQKDVAANAKSNIQKDAAANQKSNIQKDVAKLAEKVQDLKLSEQALKSRPADEPDFARSPSLGVAQDNMMIPPSLLQTMKGGTEKSKAEMRAERRAKQEAQRAAKAQQGESKVQQPASQQPTSQQKTSQSAPKPVSALKEHGKPTTASKVVKEVKDAKLERRVKLFSHLYQNQNSFKNVSHTIGVSHPQYHLSIVRLGVQYANRVVLGSNARCLALLYSLKDLIADYETPPQKEFSRGLEAYLQPNMDFLQKCRPHSVSMINALRYVKWQLTQITVEKSDAEARQHISDAIDQYIDDQIGKAAEAIGEVVKDKIDDNDVILVYACSSLVLSALKVALEEKRKFHVIVVDSLPWLEGREMLRRLVSMGVQCSYVHLSAASFVMRKVSKVLLGAHALLANGYVMSRAGSSQIALLAHAYNVPVLVCCETHKFSERVQTDSFVYNELADPDELIGSRRAGERETECVRPLANWRDIPSLSLLNLVYDVTPPDLVTAVVTERAILPCTSVPVILRIKPTEC